MDIYGFIMMDAGYNFNQIHPDWFDVVRPTKLPAFENEYGTDGNTFSPYDKQGWDLKIISRHRMGELITHFEFEMFGTGVDAGQTTIRLQACLWGIGKMGCGTILESVYGY